MNVKMCKAAFVGLVLSVSGFANAGVIVGGSDIIDHDDLIKLGTWLGNGDIDLTNIFTKTGNQTAADWHNAVDNTGATFTLIEATYNNNTYVFGGYNDYSWAITQGYNFVNSNNDASFLFSLTNDVKLAHTRYTYSTYNHPSYGATFGGGHDLHINYTLTSGYSNLGHTYGNVSQYGYNANRIILSGNYSNWAIQKYETFNVSEATAHSSVSAPSTIAIIAIGLMGLVSRRFSK